MLPDKLIFVDLETTGARSAYDRILEIGMVRVEQNVITKTFSTLLNPETRIPPEIERLTGITAMDVMHAPQFSTVRDEIMEMMQDCVFVAHNVRFDYGFLKNEMKRHGLDFSSKHFCTVKLSQYLYPEFRHHNLDSLIERHGIPCKNRHRALDDARAITDFYQIIQKRFPEETLTEAVNKAMKKPSIPLHLQKHDLENLPELPGVYLFYGDNDVPLYIGKSKNIRERVLSHFSADIRNSTEMNISQQIKQISTIVTAGELGALLLESRLIKEKLPLYNRQLRLKQQLTGLYLKPDLSGYHTLSTKTVSSVSPHDLQIFYDETQPTPEGKILGFFRSVKQAKEYLSTIAREHNLCEKMLGLEKTSSACFGYRLERCKGACIGQEMALRYNMRLTQALSDIKIKPWPFNGAIMIEEVNELAGKKEYFILDKWCYLGNAVCDSEGVIKEQSHEPQFDLDIYKIIRRYLLNPTNMRNIKAIPRSQITTTSTPALGVMI